MARAPSKKRRKARAIRAGRRAKQRLTTGQRRARANKQRRKTGN